MIKDEYLIQVRYHYHKLVEAFDSSIVHMQIVAHQDDDFLFMNPDIQNDISQKLGTITIYVTAGEANGADPCKNQNIEVARQKHATARQRAIKATYAQMANPKLTPLEADNAAWIRELITPDLGVQWPHTVERYTLKDFPQIRLIFMNLREAGEDPQQGQTLWNMLSNHNLQTNTIVPSCGSYAQCSNSPNCNPNTPWQNYKQADIVNVLSRLIQMYQPHVIRTLDPQPFQKLGSDNLCPGGGLYDVCFDNLDHTAVSRYVNQALASYHGPNSSGRSTVVYYKGYSFINYPRNLGSEAYKSKHLAGEAYRLSIPGDPYYSNEIYDPYYRVVYERYPGGTKWLMKANNGRLVAINVQNRQVKFWYEKAVGGSWQGPVSLDSREPVAPHVTLIKRKDGRLQIFAMQLPLGMERESPVPPYQEIITSVQNGMSMSFGAWQSLGSPDKNQFNGVPTALAAGNGDIFVFAKNSLGNISYTYFSKNKWSSWETINPQAKDIMDGITAVTRHDGVIEIFATSRTGEIQHYIQAGTSFVPSSDLGFITSASSPTVAKNQNNRLQIFYREIVTEEPEKYGRVLTSWVGENGKWTNPTVLYGDAGVGPIAVVRHDRTGHLMIFQRNSWGGISTTQQQNPNSNFQLQWNLRGGLFDEYPTAATDNLGRAVFMAKGADGKLYFQRQTSTNIIGNYEQWLIAGH